MRELPCYDTRCVMMKTDLELTASDLNAVQ